MKNNKSITIFFLGILVFACWVTGAENKKARELGEKKLGFYVIKCGDSWYYKRSIAGLFEMKKKGSIILHEDPLTESDRLNGYKFKGTLTYSYNGPFRNYNEGEKNWEEWFQGNVEINITILYLNDVWTSYLAEPDSLFKGETVELNCAHVPGWTRIPISGRYINQNKPVLYIEFEPNGKCSRTIQINKESGEKEFAIDDRGRYIFDGKIVMINSPSGWKERGILEGNIYTDDFGSKWVKK